MEDNTLRKTLINIKKAPDSAKKYEDWFDVLRAMDSSDRDELMQLRALCKGALTRCHDTEELKRLYDVIKRTYCYGAQKGSLRDFMFYIEWNRDPGKRFYQPRMHYLEPMVTGYQDIIDGKLDLLTISQPKRTGKAVTLDTPILTPSGFVPMRDIKVGDTVMGADGKPTTVTAVHPQGKVPVYRVKFTDGVDVRTCANHLWSVKTSDDRSKGKPARVLSTEDMLKLGLTRGNTERSRHNHFSVDYCKPQEMLGTQTHELPLHPYLLGVIIGDGNITGRGITVGKPDEELFDRLRTVLPEDCVLKEYSKQNDNCLRYGIVAKEISKSRYRPEHTVLRELRNFGLMGKRSYEKFIPDVYMTASAEARWELLRGLLDTDGGLSKCDIEFSTTSRVLSEQVAALVRSLGGYASRRSRHGKYKLPTGEIVHTRVNYRVVCEFVKDSKPFHLSRKANLYNPKREVLRHFICDIVPDGEEEAQCITVDNDEHLFVVSTHYIPTHNSQTELLATLYLSGMNPDKSSIMSGAGNELVQSFYKGMLEYLVPGNEYLFYDVFPQSKLVKTNADSMTINLLHNTRFPTVTCRSLGGTFVGSTEATNLLVVDDPVATREDAMNRAILDKLWVTIRGDVFGRRIEGTPIIMTGTRYSLYDPIGRAQDEANNLGWRWRAIEIPALDPITDESNYEHIRDGKRVFTTEFFRNERKLLDDEQWMSEFQQQPFEAHGLVFPPDKLQTYFKLPPDRSPDTVMAVCDTKEKGSDYVMMPIAYVYGDDVFIEDVVYDNGLPDFTKPECANMLLKHKVSVCTFESNNAGEYYARDVEQMLTQQGGKTSIRTKRTIANKEIRIQNASDNILKHFWFKDPSLYDRRSHYAQMIKALTTYVKDGKNPHDDAPDGMSLLEEQLRGVWSAKVEVFGRPF